MYRKSCMYAKNVPTKYGCVDTVYFQIQKNFNTKTKS